MGAALRRAMALSLVAAPLCMGNASSSAAHRAQMQAENASTLQLFAIVYRAGPKWRSGVPMEKQGLRDHFLYLRTLSERRMVLVAGPLGNVGGLVIVRAPDRRAAAEVVAADPAVKAGIFVGEVEPFSPRIGGRGPLVADEPGAGR